MTDQVQEIGFLGYQESTKKWVWCKLNKAFFHFLSAFWHIWWFFKVRHPIFQLIPGSFTNCKSYINILSTIPSLRKTLAKKHRDMPCNFATESIISTFIPSYGIILLLQYPGGGRCFWLAGSPVSLACLKACQVLSELRLSQETQNCWSSRTFEALTIYLRTTTT